MRASPALISAAAPPPVTPLTLSSPTKATPIELRMGGLRHRVATPVGSGGRASKEYSPTIHDQDGAHPLAGQLQQDRPAQPASGRRCSPFAVPVTRSRHMSETTYLDTETAS